MTDMVEPVAKKTAAERFTAANAAFAQVNRSLPVGLPPFGLPDYLAFAAGADALAVLLIEKGVITEDEYVDAKTLRAAEMIENMVDQAREAKRAALGMILAHGNPRI